MSDKNHVSEIKKGVDDWNQWRKDNSEIKPNLERADLVGADLRAANLMGADLRAANLMGADLRAANLIGANLEEADLTGSDPRGVNLSGVNLPRTAGVKQERSTPFDVNILNIFLNFGMATTVQMYKDHLPHIDLFERIVTQHEGDLSNNRERTLLTHIEKVVLNMYNLLYDRFENTLQLSEGDNDQIKSSSEGYKSLKNIVGTLKDEDKCLLLYTALCHDIGKSVIKPRHGPEGADIIKDSGLNERKRLYNLGFRRSDFYFMSDLIRFHDYLAMVGTGEASYLIFAEVLYPISNISLSNPNCAKDFLNFLILLNLSDIAGSIGKVGGEDFTILMHDFESIKKIFQKIIDEEAIKIHGTIPHEKYIEMMSKLLILSENHAHERLRRLLRNGFKDVAKQNKNKELEEYKEFIKDIYENERDKSSSLESQKLHSMQSWFSRNYEENINDIVPINSSLRGINVNPEFYTKFAFICKLDYFLTFIRGLLNKIIEIELEKYHNERDQANGNYDKIKIKNPHDLRRDISMTLVGLINILVELYGNFTSNNTKIGLGFERFNEMHNSDKMLRRLTGADGEFKEAEAYTKLRNMVVLWVITP